MLVRVLPSLRCYKTEIHLALIIITASNLFVFVQLIFREKHKQSGNFCGVIACVSAYIHTTTDSYNYPQLRIVYTKTPVDVMARITQPFVYFSTEYECYSSLCRLLLGSDKCCNPSKLARYPGILS